MGKNMLTEHFSLEELIRTTHKQIVNIPDEAGVIGLTEICREVLEPLRTRVGGPIKVSSGYRTKELNLVVGGSKNSQHVANELWAAVDIDQGTKEQNKAIFFFIERFAEFDQLINEKDYSWIHVSYRTDGKNRMQVLNLP